MSEVHNEDVNACITIEAERNAQILSSNNNANEQTLSSQHHESLACLNGCKDVNGVLQQQTRSNPTSSLNPEVLTAAVHFTPVEEGYGQSQQLGSDGSQIPHHNENDGLPEVLEYQREYPITRFSRKWKRPEVQGFCCLAMEVICLASLAVLGLQAVGYFDTIREGGHLPLSFSWKILWEFFGNTTLPKKLLQCLYSSIGGKMFVHTDDYGAVEPIGSMDVNYVLFEALSSPVNPNENSQPVKTRANLPIPSMNPDRNLCEFSQGQRSLAWLIRFFLVTNFMPVLNVMTSTLLYTSLAVRRRKGMQVLLLLPSFFCFFVSIFQQIPISFQYNYFDQALVKEMSQTLSQSTPPFYVVPILDETQVHHKCCGVEFPESWEKFGASLYPPSCCNSTAFDCSKLQVIKREHTWSVGCFQVEHEKIHSFERWALFLYALKVIAEVGMFCTLSDLTRFDYPPPETQETSRCDFREYQVKCRGVMHIKGVTKNGRIVVESKYFLPWRLVPSRTDMLNGLQLYLKTDHNRTKGSVEVVKRHNVANFLNEDIQIDLSKKNRGIFVFTMI